MAEEADSQGFMRELRSRLIQIAIPAGLATALLYAYGWMFARELYRQMGIDTDLLDFSTTDYVVRSLDSFVSPIPIFAAWVAVLTMVAFIVIGVLLEVIPRLLRHVRGNQAPHDRNAATQSGNDGTLATSRESDDVADETIVTAKSKTDVQTEEETRIALVVAMIGAGFCAACMLLAATWRPSDEVGDALLVVSLVTAATAAAYGVRQCTEFGLPKLETIGVGRTLVRGCAMLLAVVLSWSLFNVTLAYAKHRGRVAATKIANESGWRPEVVLYSTSPLGLERTGAVVNVVELSGGAGSPGDATAIYRYSGFLMVTEAGDKLVVWPCELRLLDQGAVILKANDPGVWLDVRPVLSEPAGGNYVPCSEPFAPLLDFYENGDTAEFTRYLDFLDAQYVRRATTRRSIAVARFVAEYLDFDAHSDDDRGGPTPRVELDQHGAIDAQHAPPSDSVRNSLCISSWWAQIVEPVQELTPPDVKEAICGR